jgi:hypothetical protein
VDERPDRDDVEPAPEAQEEPLEAFYGDDPIFGMKLSAPPPEAPRVPPKKARTATGALLTGIALGLRDVFDPEKKKDTIAIEQEAPSEPDEPQEYEIRLAGSPRDSQAIYRPWVKEDDEPPG